MNPTRWILVVHVLSALWLAAGSFAGAVVRAQAKREESLAGRVAALRIAWRLSSVCAIPGATFAGFTGLYLLGPMGYGFEPGWVHVSLTIWLLLLGTHLLYLAPRAKKILAAAEASLEAGAPSEELRRLSAAKAPAILADISALAIVVLVILMAVRPF